VKIAKVTSTPQSARLPRRARLWLVLALFLFYSLVVAGNALADNPDPIEVGQQDAATAQEAAANGVATQSEPVNIIVSVRIDSPGNDGAISQSNVTVGGVEAGNDSGTTQTGADGQQGIGQQAATGQDATATGEGTQSHPTNIVISIRINSPGNDGPVSQTNVVVVGVNADNTSLTTQGGSAGGENTPKTAVPLPQGLRHSAAPAEAADVTTAKRGRRSAPRRSARVPGHAGGLATKSLGRPGSGAAAAHSAGFPAAAARASSAKRVEAGHAVTAGAVPQAAANLLRRFESVLPTSPRADRPAHGSGLVTLTAIALLGALLVWASSSWLGGLRAVWRGQRW
jgi:hypothetical protein